MVSMTLTEGWEFWEQVFYLGFIENEGREVEGEH